MASSKTFLLLGLAFAVLLLISSEVSARELAQTQGSVQVDEYGHEHDHGHSGHGNGHDHGHGGYHGKPGHGGHHPPVHAAAGETVEAGN